MEIMKLTYTLSILCLALSTTYVYAENYLAFLGGGGEPEGRKTIFDGGLKGFAPNLNNSGWQYEMSFNGGHTETEKILREQFPRSTKTSNFTSKNYKELIENYKAKILLGEIRPGDQFVVILNTHGAQNNGRQETHLIATTGKAAGDLNNLSNANLVNVDDLAELVKLTNERGITMGIVDLSCHSGSTQKLKSPNTCIVTATGPIHYAFTGGGAFMDKFLSSFKPGTTMEQAFLKARAESNDASYPMISTEENQSIVKDMYNHITPYLYYYDPTADKMTGYLTENSKDQLVCRREEQFNDLIRKIENFKKLVPGSPYADQLKNMLTQYKRQQDELLNKIRNLGGHNLDKQEQFITPVAGSPRPLAITHSWKNLLNEDPDKWIAHYSAKVAKEKNPKEKAFLTAQVEHHKKMRRKKEEILFQYPDIRNAEKESKEIVKLMGENRNTAESIAKEERKFYDDLYKMRQGLNYNDPCRKIKM